MEPTQNHFSLTTQLAKWQQTMAHGSLTSDDLTELTDHLTEEISSLQKAGLNDEEAWMVARQRIGQPVVIEAEFRKVNPDHLANRNLVMMFWGAIFFMTLQIVCFALPSIINSFFRPLDSRGFPSNLLSATDVRNMLYAEIAIIAVFVLAVVFKGNRIVAWFSEMIEKYYFVCCLLLLVASPFLISFNDMMVLNHLIHGMRSVYSPEIQTAGGVLSFVIYIPLIAFTVFYTLRYRSQDIRNIASFAGSINWQASLMLGILFKLVSLSTYSFFPVSILNTILPTIIFFFAGWLMGRSKRPWVNTLILHSPSLVLLPLALLPNSVGFGDMFNFLCKFVLPSAIGCTSSILLYRKTQLA
ncbi:hypothetical protein [Mucilaginibacter myungsuensis]|uniref:Uncharacterized protein n=1 Tax=Mucilaginibacter myungsuensis TaxID=649104 RepID=A0A929PU88_9SPHI|nr:hypothetical protein [Mucilaginibacter myungsuensis]MBE9660483.1 hypothetical protein [Mucilaginibacter myungsuensis]MDN3600527.1 hypothetical protein [Mucilaginibacter myungsuensis]